MDEKPQVDESMQIQPQPPSLPPISLTHQQDTLKIITDIEAIRIESEPKAPVRKPVKSGSPGHRDLKSLFVLSSSHGATKSNVKKLNDCLMLFETLYEKKPEFSESNKWNGWFILTSN